MNPFFASRYSRLPCGGSGDAEFVDVSLFGVASRGLIPLVVSGITEFVDTFSVGVEALERGVSAARILHAIKKREKERAIVGINLPMSDT